MESKKCDENPPKDFFLSESDCKWAQDGIRLRKREQTHEIRATRNKSEKGEKCLGLTTKKALVKNVVVHFWAYSQNRQKF